MKEEITKSLLDEAEAYLGCAVTYTLMEWVKENLEKLLAKQPLTLEACSDAVSSLHLEDKVKRNVKFLFMVSNKFIICLAGRRYNTEREEGEACGADQSSKTSTVGQNGRERRESERMELGGCHQTPVSDWRSTSHQLRDQSVGTGSGLI